MIRMTGPDCAVMYNDLINLYTTPIWGMQDAMQENTSPTQSSGRKTSIGARSPLPTPSFLSLCRHVCVVTLAQTCMPSSRSSPSDGYSTYMSETYSNESQHLAEGTEVARFFGGDSLLFYSRNSHSARTRHHICRQGVALASTRPSHSQGPASVQAHRTGGVIESEGQEGANGVGGGIRVGGGNGDGNGDVNGQGDGEGAGMGTGVEVNEGAQDGNGDGSGDGAGTETGTGVGTHRRTPDGNGDGNGDGSEDSSEDGGTGTTITGTGIMIGSGRAEDKTAK